MRQAGSAAVLGMIVVALANSAAAGPGGGGGGGGAPPPPTGLYVPPTDSDGTYTVDWNASPGASYYLVEKKTGSGSWTSHDLESSTHSYITNQPEGTYSYRV